MYRISNYIILFVVTMLLQTFVFDNLALSVYFNPLIYITIVILLPVESLPVTVLLTGFATGFAADMLTGGEGLNAAATLPAALLRQPLLTRYCSRDDLRDGGIPSARQMGGQWRFAGFAATITAIHHGLYFFMEALTFSHFFSTLLRIVLSGGFTLVFVVLTSRVFTDRKTSHI